MRIKLSKYAKMTGVSVRTLYRRIKDGSLARFGLNYIEKLLNLQGRKIEILNPQNNDEDDLMQDFVSIITSFVARLYGRRRSKRLTEKIIQEAIK